VGKSQNTDKSKDTKDLRTSTSEISEESEVVENNIQDDKKTKTSRERSNSTREPLQVKKDISKKHKKRLIKFQKSHTSPQEVPEEGFKVIILQKPSFWGLETFTQDNKTKVSKFLGCCMEFVLNEERVSMEGVFRKAGDETLISVLLNRIALDEEKILNGSCIEETDSIHDVCSIFKRFFRELGDPLFTFKSYQLFIGAEVLEEPLRSDTIRNLINSLPSFNYNICKKLFNFLTKVSQYSDKNLMNSKNLAIVFAPSLLRPEIESPITYICDSAYQTSMVMDLIDNIESFFPSKKK